MSKESEFLSEHERVGGNSEFSDPQAREACLALSAVCALLLVEVMKAQSPGTSISMPRAEMRRVSHWIEGLSTMREMEGPAASAALAGVLDFAQRIIMSRPDGPHDTTA